MVTCYSCHRGGDHPKVTREPGGALRRDAHDEMDDDIPAGSRAPSADQILRQVRPGAWAVRERLAKLTSFVAKGTSSGYGPESDKRPIEIYAKAPRQRTIVIHTANGDNTTTYDGSSGWIAAPLRPVAVIHSRGANWKARNWTPNCLFRGGSRTRWDNGASDVRP